MTVDETHDPARRSWVPGADGHAEFPIQNLPYGVFSILEDRRAGTAIGDRILDLHGAAMAGLLPDEAASALTEPTLNALLGIPHSARRALRARLSELLSDSAHREHVAPLLHDAHACALHVPATIGDYTDFYAGIHHARNIGRLFRPDAPLLPNYKYVPIGYHGRASSVSVSGEAVTRPNGQRKTPDQEIPSFGPARRLDYELELGIWIGGPANARGQPVPIAQADARVAGLCLLNDWSARDLQAWEYQPLGPFLAKSFCTTISPWIVTAEALIPFRIPQPPRPDGDPVPLPYLWDEADQRHGAYSLQLEVHLLTQSMRDAGDAPHRLSRGPADSLYWTAAQMIAHHASNGCNLSPGDLLGTGTISTAEPDGWGSLMELAHGGTRPLALPNGEQRAALEDGDEIILSARAHAPGFVSIGFGPCHARILPAKA